MNENSKTLPGTALYISHGGGPLPLLGDPAHNEMVDMLKNVVTVLPKPSAIIVISAHWEAGTPTITAGQHPSLIYDYYGFPKESYEIEYPAPGAPALAKNIFELLKSNGIEAVLDEERGFDHGLFVPLKIMYPDADIPCVQVSLLKSLDPEEHIQLGKALSHLSNENILVLGSGFSFHNLKAFFTLSSNVEQSMNELFEQWLIDTCTSREISESERKQRLVNWEKASAARYCHPREEHLLPLHVCYGFSGSPAKQAFTFNIMDKKASAYLW